MADHRDDASIRTEGLIREILGQVCARRGIVILSTPYLRFESSFLRLDQDRVQCLATMDLEDAKYGLRSPGLRMRFPSGRHFYEAATQMLGLGRADGRQSLQLALPVLLDNGDARSSYRVERVGRVPVTFSTRRYELLQGHLVNLSTTGLRVLLNRDYEDGELLVDDRIHVDFTLAETLRVNARVEIRHLRGRTFGAEFRPVLADEVLEPLSQWVFKRREEDVLEQGPPAGARAEAGAGSAVAGGEFLLVGGSAELGERLAGLLGPDLPPLRRVAPNIQSMRDLGPGSRVLVLFHVDSEAWEGRKRLRALADALPVRVPRVLLGSGLDSGALYDLGTELKAAWTCPLPSGSSSLFPRLLMGVYRKHYPAGQEGV
jgi:hypothetical protein